MGGMIQIADLLAVADAYKAATGLPDGTVSSRVFADSKKLAAMRVGSDITITRFNQALLWFSTNWPEEAEWPADITRPAQAIAAAE